MVHYRCDDEGGGAANDSDDEDESSGDSPSQDESEETSNNDDSGSNSDTDFDYQSYMGGSSENENPMGLSLGADKMIDEIGKMQDEVDRYSAREHADSYGDRAPYQRPLDSGGGLGQSAPQVPGQRPFDVPYTGAPDEPLISIDPTFGWGRKPDIRLVPGVALKLRFTDQDYGAGVEVGGSIGDVMKRSNDKSAPLFDPRAGAGFYVNFDRPEKSNFYAGAGIKTPVGGKDLVGGEYSVNDFKSDAEKLYMEALRAIGYPPTSPYSNPW
jgi:hypothetical protein